MSKDRADDEICDFRSPGTSDLVTQDLGGREGEKKVSTWILSPLFSKVQPPNVIVDPPEGHQQPMDSIRALSGWRPVPVWKCFQGGGCGSGMR